MVKHSNVLGAPNWRDISSLASLNAKQLLTRYDSVVNMKRPFPYWDPSADVELGRPLRKRYQFVVLRRQLCICDRLHDPRHASQTSMPASLHGDMPLTLCDCVHSLACPGMCAGRRLQCSQTDNPKHTKILQSAVCQSVCLGHSQPSRHTRRL